MLRIVDSFSKLNMDELLAVYEQRNLEYGRSVAPSGSQWEQLRWGEDHMRQYLMDFLNEVDTRLALWYAEDACVAALRLEVYSDGYLVSGLETAPNARRRGYGTSLLLAVAKWFPEPIYSHVSKRNHGSLSVHKAAGFVVSCDHARLLDGTVSQNYFTLTIH